VAQITELVSPSNLRQNDSSLPQRCSTLLALSLRRHESQPLHLKLIGDAVGVVG